MAAERTPSRRKQCIFRRTFQRFPFGKCERRSRSSSCYDVHNAAASKSKTSGKWSPTDPTIPTFNVHQAGCREGVERVEKTQPTNAVFNVGHGDGVVLEPISSIHHVSNLLRSQHLHLPHHHTDSMTAHPDLEQPDADSAYSSVSYSKEQHHRHVVSPPSPSISSMETDVGVDPETGERAME